MTTTGCWAVRLPDGVAEAQPAAAPERHEGRADEGKMADPEDFFHAFMLNEVPRLGLRRAAEMWKAVGAPEAPRLARKAPVRF